MEKSWTCLGIVHAWLQSTSDSYSVLFLFSMLSVVQNVTLFSFGYISDNWSSFFRFHHNTTQKYSRFSVKYQLWYFGHYLTFNIWWLSHLWLDHDPQGTYGWWTALWWLRGETETMYECVCVCVCVWERERERLQYYMYHTHRHINTTLTLLTVLSFYL